MIFSYLEDGGRTAFDPLTMGPHLSGCLLCNRRVKVVGLFMPLTDVMRSVVMRLRRHPQPARSTGCIAYGLCARCLKHADATDRVEALLKAMAERVTLQ